jgi:hypothetical protein
MLVVYILTMNLDVLLSESSFIVYVSCNNVKDTTDVKRGNECVFLLQFYRAT